MEAIKRLYLYSASGLGLGLLLAGSMELLQLAVQSLAPGGSGARGGYDPGLREVLATAIGLVVVGLPLWLAHWGWLERSIARRDATSAAERDSAIRILYLTIVLAVLLAWWASSAIDFIRQFGFRVLRLDYQWETNSLGQLFAVPAIAVLAWAYHARIRLRDLGNAGPLAWSTGWIDRLYVYGALLLAGVGLLASIVSAAGALIDAAAGSGRLGPQYAVDYAFDNSWQRSLVTALAGIAVLSVVVATHGIYAQRRRSSPEHLGQAERVSAIRLAFMVALVAIGAGVAVSSLGTGVGDVVARVAGSVAGTPSGVRWADAARSFLMIIPFGIVWLFLWRQAVREYDPSSGSNAARPLGYVAAAIGFGLLASSLVTFVMLLVEGESRWAPCCDVIVTGPNWRDQVCVAAGQSLAGLALAIWAWLAIRRRVGLNRAAEARAPSRRVYLFGIIGAAVMYGGFAAVELVHELAGDLLGAATYGDVRSQLAWPLGVGVTAAVLLAAHLPVLARDLAVSRAGGATDGMAPVAAPAVEHAPPLAPEGPRRVLVVSGPAGADLEALRAALAERVPIGYSVRIADDREV